MRAASRVASVILVVLLVPLTCAGCSLLSGTVDTSSAANKTINSALDHMRAASDIREDINHQLDLCSEAYDIAEPDRATDYAEAAQELLPEYDAEQATAKKLLTSVGATDAGEDSKRHALLLLDWVESRITEATALSQYVAAKKVVAAAGPSLTEDQVNEEYRLRLEMLEEHRIAGEKVAAANDFSRVKLGGQSSTTVPVSKALLIDYDHQLRTVLAWRSAMVTITNLRTYKYNETGPNRSIEPGDLVVEELQTLVALVEKLPTPPPSLAAADSAWRLRVGQLLEAEQALAQEDAQIHRDDRAWIKDKEYAAMNELVDMVAQQMTLIDSTTGTTQATATTAATTTTSKASQSSPEVQTYLDELNQLGQRYWDTRVTLDFETNGPGYPVNKQVVEVYTALATSARNVSVPDADPELMQLRDEFVRACENVLRRQSLEDAALNQVGGGGGDIRELSEKYASAREAGEASDSDFQAFRAGLEALGVDIPWGK